VNRDIDIFPQYTINLAAKSSVLDLFSNIAMNMVQCKVRADAVSNFPPLDILANCNNLTCAVRARDDIGLLTEIRVEREFV
jgi:hypothetical protein